MCAWKQMLKNYVSLLDEVSEKLKNQESVLRFNQPAAIASDVAQQYYCEKKVEMAYILGKIETETKRLGTEAHQILLEGSEEIKTEELWEEIFSEKFVSALEWFLVAKYKNIVLAGRPDCIRWGTGGLEHATQAIRGLSFSRHTLVRTYAFMKALGSSIFSSCSSILSLSQYAVKINSTPYILTNENPILSNEILHYISGGQMLRHRLKV